MGDGPARELEVDTGPPPELSPGLSNKLGQALDRMDQVDEAFRTARDEERQAQMAKRWAKQCKDILMELRTIIKVLHESHQLSLDIGSDGGGRGTRPWVEETAHTFDRLYLSLEDSGSVLASAGDLMLARSPLADINYEWLEKLVVVWVVRSIDARTRGGPRLG